MSKLSSAYKAVTGKKLSSAFAGLTGGNKAKVPDLSKLKPAGVPNSLIILGGTGVVAWLLLKGKAKA